VSGQKQYVSGRHQTHFNQATGQEWERNCTSAFALPIFLDPSAG